MAKSKEKEQESKSSATTELAQALVEAINITKPAVKKTISTRTKNTPWTVKDGVKPTLKKKIYQHGLLVDPNKMSSEEILLANKLKAGVFCDGVVKVIRRKDRGLSIEYPVRTASQRLRLINDFGFISFVAILTRLVDEAANPRKIDLDEVDE